MIKKIEPLTLLIEGSYVFIPIKKSNGTARLMADNIVKEIETLYQNRHLIRAEYLEQQPKLWEKSLYNRVL